jgi:ribosomal protein S18 acetylase RimI-like enzyme
MIRRLHEADIESLLAIRREALNNDPETFSASPATDVGLDPDFVRRSLASPDTQATFGAFQDGTLVGMVGVYREEGEKEHHKAVLWGMFVSPSRRGAGLGRALIAEAVGFARSLPGVTHVHLEVSEIADAARRLYEAAGFQTWGIEPESLVVDGSPVAARHMVLELADGAI